MVGRQEWREHTYQLAGGASSAEHSDADGGRGLGADRCGGGATGRGGPAAKPQPGGGTGELLAEDVPCTRERIQRECEDRAARREGSASGAKRDLAIRAPGHMKKQLLKPVVPEIGQRRSRASAAPVAAMNASSSARFSSQTAPLARRSANATILAWAR